MGNIELLIVIFRKRGKIAALNRQDIGYTRLSQYQWRSIIIVIVKLLRGMMIQYTFCSIMMIIAVAASGTAGHGPRRSGCSCT